jgi:hypothetical protein
MKSKVLKVLKVLGIIVGVLVAGFLVIYAIYNEKLPQGETGERAEALTDKMFAAIDKTAWDTTKFVQWSFRDAHDYLWDKERNWVNVKWDDNEVFLNLNEITGVAYASGELLDGKAKDKMIQKAWSFFANDSFWLNAPVKARDKGTERRVVTMEDGTEALLITYASGGVTPGDSYLWILDENGLPIAWKMWVKIIPIGGVYTSWEDWKTLENGVKIAQNHMLAGKANIPITKLKTGQSLSDFEKEANFFDK